RERTAASPTTALLVGRIDVLPHLRRDRLARTTRVLPHRFEGTHDRTRVALVVGEQCDEELDVDGVVVEFTGEPATHRREQVPARRVLVAAAIVEQRVGVDVEDARGALHPLAVAAHPIERLRDPAEHHSARCCCCCCCCCWVTVDGVAPPRLPNGARATASG